MIKIKSSYLFILAAIALSFASVGCSDSDDPTDIGDIVGLEINPSSLDITVDSPQTIVFSVSGGTEPYTWSVSESTLGAIDLNGQSAVYESTTTAGSNVIMVRDSLDNVGSVVIGQTSSN